VEADALMATYTVKGAGLKKDNIQSQYGVFKTLNLFLQEQGQTEQITAEWYTKQDTPIPAEGSTLEGEITVDPQFGPKFKKAQQGGGFAGGGFRGKGPEERRSIAMQHAQKCAVTVLQIAAEHGEYTPPSAGDVVGQVKTVAEALFQQVLAAEKGA
jgi:hypothetical protein